MATSNFPSDQYTASNFTESCGAIAIRRSTWHICLIHQVNKNGLLEFLLPKGRREVGECRTFTAVREVQEETGYTCRLLEVKLNTRAPPSGVDTSGPFEHDEKGEPFMVTLRQTSSTEVKIIWWYVGEIDEGVAKAPGEEKFQAGLASFDDALKKLTYEDDRRVVEEAVRIYENSYPAARS